jgi:hypothetical protein
LDKLVPFFALLFWVTPLLLYAIIDLLVLFLWVTALQLHAIINFIMFIGHLSLLVIILIFSIKFQQVAIFSYLCVISLVSCIYIAYYTSWFKQYTYNIIMYND